jgi:hypothetical protein
VRIGELSDWLATLDTAWQEGRWQAARIGLNRWLDTGRQYLSDERSALAANTAPTELRAELKGRLAALKMKARVRGVAQNESMDALAREAERLLHEYPVPLDRISAAVSEYEAQLMTRAN